MCAYFIRRIRYYKDKIEFKEIQIENKNRESQRMFTPLFTIDGSEAFQITSVSELINMEKKNLKTYLRSMLTLAERPESVEHFDLYLETDKGVYKECECSYMVEKFDISDTELTVHLKWPNINVNRECKSLGGYITFHNRILRTVTNLTNLDLDKGDELKIEAKLRCNISDLLN